MVRGAFAMSVRSFGIIFSVLVLFATAAVPAANAGEIASLALKAEQLLQQGKPVAAYEALDAAMDRLWQRMPLTVRKAVFVVGKPGGFGVYNPRENAVFKRGEPLIVYLELAGFGHKPLSGAYEISISGDVAIADESGQKILANMGNFLKSHMVSRRKNREYFVNLTIELSGAPAGRYQLILTLKDNVSGEKAKVRMPFEIRS